MTPEVRLLLCGVGLGVLLTVLLLLVSAYVWLEVETHRAHDEALYGVQRVQR